MFCRPFKQALDCIRNKDYDDIVKLCTSEVDKDQSAHVAEALLLRGTFYLLRGEGGAALQDFDKLINLKDVDKRVRCSLCVTNVGLFE